MILLLNKYGRWAGVLFVLYLVMPMPTRAQQTTRDRVTLDLHKASMDTVLLLVQQQTGIRLYYDTTDLDTTRLDIKVDQRPVSNVLTDIFQGTDLSFSTDRYGNIFITKGAAIETELPGDYFHARTAGNAAVAAAGDAIR